MARPRKIRIAKNDRIEFARLVKNTKAKIARTIKNYGKDISGEIEIPSSVEDFKTRKEYNEWKKKQEWFTSRSNTALQFKKNKRGVVKSVKEINEVKKNNRIAIQKAKKLEKEAKKKPFISGGKEQGTVEQRMKQMGRPNMAGINVPAKFDFDKIVDDRQFERKKESMEKRSSETYFNERMEKMKENFIKILELSFNSDADELVKKIREIPADDFYEMYLMFDEFDFDLYSSDNEGGFAEDSHIKQMESYVDIYQRGGVNFDLKGF